MTELQSHIEVHACRGSNLDLEVLLVEQRGATPCGCSSIILRGVTLALCEQVTGALEDVRERYTLEVSSPGAERPLSKPEHFQRFVGRRVRIRIGQGVAGVERRTLTGELVGASAHEVTLALDDGVVAIPYAAMQRSHLVEE